MKVVSLFMLFCIWGVLPSEQIFGAPQANQAQYNQVYAPAGHHPYAMRGNINVGAILAKFPTTSPKLALLFYAVAMAIFIQMYRGGREYNIANPEKRLITCLFSAALGLGLYFTISAVMELVPIPILDYVLALGVPLYMASYLPFEDIGGTRKAVHYVPKLVVGEGFQKVLYPLALIMTALRLAKQIVLVTQAVGAQ